MPLDDLDLEFEDEEESKKKKSEAFHVDVDLEFQSPQGAERPRSIPQKPVFPGAPAGSAPARVPPARPPGVVQKLDDARPQPLAVKRPVPVSNGGSPRVVGSSALREDSYDLESEQIVAMRAQVQKIEFDAEVKVQVAEFKTELLSELNGDMKLMEHQVNQLLVRINAKHPDMKQEALMIKKILADFTSKKRK